ncbi:hypothetical protein JAAARDRAFT_136995 [Jaapia argillacea MUCL 33604]|uniref:Haloacid dehalogenase-like hydrolase domain-containing protein 3 n=1 Tax=Jaapia argillacea MUCL 33604 TaxID=933084 RepID=A0A067PFN7_9AGAM|nr:hypothetical protein JAAARDRAFT_136995 [Jaapia argillacea MUCL 33604]
MIRLVTFDALHTILKPRLPIYVQYSQTFEPYLGVLQPEALKRSFKVALKQVQTEKPVYGHENGSQGWWGEVIRRTAIGAGADPIAVTKHISTMTPLLIERFSSKQGYTLYPDTIPTFDTLREMGIKIGVISNCDSRMRGVLDDLKVTPYLSTIVLSQDEGFEKPEEEMFLRAYSRVDEDIKPEQVVHVGDDLECDYKGAREAGLHALLIRRPDVDSEEKKVGEDVRAVSGLDDVVTFVEVLNWVDG